MAKKVFRRVGIRRDKNFSDLSNSETSLNNLLGDLVSAAGETFVSEDLNCLRNSFSLNFTPEGYLELNNSTFKITNAAGATADAVPTVTFENRIDQFRITSGTKPRLSGGEGLTAKYYQSDQVNSSNSNIFVGVSTLGSIPDDKFWERGRFVYDSGKFNLLNADNGGGIAWEGFIVTQFTGPLILTTNMSVSYVADVADAPGENPSVSMTNYANIKSGIITVGSGVTFTNTGDFPDRLYFNNPVDKKFVASGMVITNGNAGIRAGSVVQEEDNTVINSNYLILIPPTNDGSSPFTGTGSNSTCVFQNTAGSDIRKRLITPPLEEYKPYRVRFKIYLKEDIDPFNTISKFFRIQSSTNVSTTNDLYYTDLYPVDYNFADESGKGTFDKFLSESITSGGTAPDQSLGGTGSLQTYVKIKSSKKANITYEPKKAYLSSPANLLTDVFKKDINDAAGLQGTAVIRTARTADLEIGNLVFGNGITNDFNKPAVIKDKSRSASITINSPVVGTSISNVIVIEHRGFVQRFQATRSGNTLTTTDGSTLSNLKKGMVVIAEQGNPTNYTRITQVTGSNQITLNQQPSGTGNQFYYVYEDRGLRDNSLVSFCQAANTECFTVNQATPVTQGNLINVDFTGNNIAVGWIVLGAPFSDFDINGDPEPTVVTGKTSTQLTLSKNIIAPISAGSRFTATNLNDDRSLCCPPTDTAPPFTATAEGLITPSNRKSVTLDGGNIVFNEFVCNNSTNDSSMVTTVGTNDTSNRRLDIRCNGIDYEILCSS